MHQKRKFLDYVACLSIMDISAYIHWCTKSN